MQKTITLKELRFKIAQLCQAGQLGQAINILKAVATRGVWDYGCLYLLVDTALSKDRAREIKPLIDELTKQRAKEWQVWELRYKLFRSTANWTEALEMLTRVETLSSSPMSWVWLAKAEALERLFRPEEALLALDELAASETVMRNSRYWYLRAAALFQLGERETLIDDVLPALQVIPEDQYLASAWKVLGKSYDSLEMYEEAFDAFKLANTMLLKNQTLAENPLRRRIEVYQQLYSKKWVSQWTDFPADDEPVFLVGFPRSGTTLLEQVLDSHEHIQALEEPPTMSRVMQELVPWLNASALQDGTMRPSQDWKRQWLAGFDYMSRLTESKLDELRGVYYEAVNERLKRDKGRLLIDKMPLNSVEMGLILRLFPRARFIVAVRHPCDCVLSGYMQPFQMNESMANFVDLEAAAIFYKNVMRLLWQYEEVFDLEGRVHVVRYEDLVADLEGEAKRIMDFLGLGWDDAVLEFDSHARQRQTLATPSYQGVTQKIYTASVERWRHYSKQMRPVLTHFREAADRYGYDLC